MAAGSTVPQEQAQAEQAPDLIGQLAEATEEAAKPSRVKQSPYPQEGATRFCTYPGHEGENPLPFTPEDHARWPLRKSGPKAGSALGWCDACQKLSRDRNKREPERQGTRPRTPKVPVINYGQFIPVLPASHYAPDTELPVAAKPKRSRARKA